MKERHVLFFDMDGTILYKINRFPRAVRKAIRRAQSEGHLVVLNTGRPKENIPRCVRRGVHWDGFICGGGYAEILGEVVQDDRFSQENFDNIVKLVKKYRIPTRFDGHGGSIPIYRSYRGRRLKSISEIYDKKMIDRTYKIQMGMILPEEGEKELSKYCSLFRMGSYYDVFVPNRTKATGMRLICEKVGVDPKNTMAFGDNANDVPMCAFAGVSVAMKRSKPALIAAATYHAESRYLGVKEGLEKFLFD